MSKLLSFTEEILPDVRRVTDVGFGAETGALLKKILSNPLRSLCRDAGNLVVDDTGRPKAFQATIVRSLVMGREKFVGLYGAMLCALGDADPVDIGRVVERSVTPRAGSHIYYANTACRATYRLNKLYGKIFTGPESCAAQRLQPIHWTRFAWYMFVHKVFHRPNLGGKVKRHQGDEKFDGLEAFWQRYVEKAKGLCSSRSIEELRWAFGEDKYVILKHGDDTVDGYIVLKSDSTGNRWSIADWIALGNDETILEDILVAAKRFLKRKTHAMLFQTTGFPTFVQPILARHFKYLRPLNSNEFIYRFDDAALKEKVQPLMDTKASWFFGPYDGDSCLF